VRRSGKARYTPIALIPEVFGPRHIAGVTAEGNGGSRWTLRGKVALALDVLIAAYAVALVVIGVTGGIDLGFVSLRQAEKPVLILALLIPIRAALGGRSPLVDGVLRPLAPRVMPLWTTVADLVRGHPAVVDVGFALVATRAATFVIGFIANLLFVPTRGRPFEMPFERVRLAEIFAAWDSGWYFDIASRGYYFNPGGQSSIAFFPLYPMLMRAFAMPFGGSDKAIWVSGIAVACASFALALLVIHQFTARVFGDRETARRAVLYLSVFPFSLFFTRVYAESVFLLMSALAISRAYDARWWQAGLWGALATIARPNGILIGLPLVLMALAGRPAVRDLVHRLVALSPVPLALAGYCGYVYTLSGDPLGWLNAQAHWGYSLGHPPWQQLLQLIARLVDYGFYDYFFLSPLAPFRLFHGVAGLLFLVLLPAIFSRLGLAMGAYVLVSLLVPLSGNALEGVGRYAAVLFPAFMLLGSIKSSRAHDAILIASSLYLAFFVCLFVSLRPIY
jgi:mannosyltransferase PIG-V